jgi:hypothetical protein
MALKRQAGRTQGRQVGRGDTRNSGSMTRIQQLWLCALVMFLQDRKEAVFIGSVGTTGSLRFNFYVGDEKTWTSWNLHEDWRTLCLQTLSDLFEEDISEEDVIRAVPWLAEKAAEVPPDKKPAYRSSAAAELPQRPS